MRKRKKEMEEQKEMWKGKIYIEVMYIVHCARGEQRDKGMDPLK